jgi:hypothetical protein
MADRSPKPTGGSGSRRRGRFDVYPELAATSFEDDELRVAMQSRQLIIHRRITDSSGDGEAVARSHGDG